MNVINLTESEFIQHVADFRAPHSAWRYFGNLPAIVDFYAGWCGPCRVLAPVLEELAAVYKDQIVVYKVDVDRCEALAEAYDIRSIPTTLFIPMKGRPVKMVGAISKKELDRQIHEVLLKGHLHHIEI
jgi:thioredoxin